MKTVVRAGKVLRRLIDAFVMWLTSPGLAVVVGETLYKLFGFRRKGPFRIDKVKSVLIVRLDQIGDAVLTTPLIREVRRSMPHSEITLVVRAHVKDLFDCCPYVNEVLSYDPRLVGHLPAVQQHWRALALAARYLWKKRIDLAIAPRFNRDMYHALFVAYFSGAAWRMAYEQPRDDTGTRYDFNRLLSHGFVGKEGVIHEVERNTEFLRHLGLEPVESALELWTSESDLERVVEELAVRGIATAPLVAVAPGAREQKRVWPIAQFCALMPWLMKRLAVSIVVVGDSQEWPLGEQMAAIDRTRIFNLCGLFNLRSLAGLLDQCILFVGNDSGPMHIAAARGVPVVEISAYPETAPAHRPMSPMRFRPWGVAYKVARPHIPVPPCTGPCVSHEAHCIRSVSVRAVIESIEALVQETDTKSRLMVSTQTNDDDFAT